MISFCTLGVRLSGTAPRARSKLVVWSQYESPRTKVDSIEKKRKRRRREQMHRRSKGQWANRRKGENRKEEDGKKEASSRPLANITNHPVVTRTTLLLYFTSFLISPNSATVKSHRRGVRKTRRRVIGLSRLLLPRLLIANSTQSWVYTWHLSHDISIQRYYHCRYNIISEKNFFDIYISPINIYVQYMWMYAHKHNITRGYFELNLPNFFVN